MDWIVVTATGVLVVALGVALAARGAPARDPQTWLDDRGLPVSARTTAAVRAEIGTRSWLRLALAVIPAAILLALVAGVLELDPAATAMLAGPVVLLLSGLLVDVLSRPGRGPRRAGLRRRRARSIVPTPVAVAVAAVAVAVLAAAVPAAVDYRTRTRAAGCFPELGVGGLPPVALGGLVATGFLAVVVLAAAGLAFRAVLRARTDPRLLEDPAVDDALRRTRAHQALSSALGAQLLLAASLVPAARLPFLDITCPAGAAAQQTLPGDWAVVLAWVTLVLAAVAAVAAGGRTAPRRSRTTTDDGPQEPGDDGRTLDLTTWKEGAW